MRYYFDHRDGDLFISDDEGVELDGIESARDEATKPVFPRWPSLALIIGASLINVQPPLLTRGCSRTIL